MSRIPLCLLLITGICTAVEPAAADPPSARTDPAVLAAACANCHGTEGKLCDLVPHIGGRPAHVLLEQLKAFREDRMPATTIMNRIARGYTEEELEILARYFGAARRGENHDG